MAGDEITGASTFRLEAGLDTGPVYGVMTERVLPTDTAGDLLGRLAVGGAGLLVATLDGIADGSLTPRPQSTEGVSLAPKVEPADAEVDWARPAPAVDRLVRGCTPAPGAWSTFRGERVGLLPVRVDEGYAGPVLAAGELAAGKREVHVGTAAGTVVLGEVRPRGRKHMPAADWARGLRIAAGERFGHA
jgi:methionyl-tRNA formyltransferase